MKVVNSTFLADIIHNGLLPAVLLPRHTALDQPEEFNPKVSFEASRILGNAVWFSSVVVDSSRKLK